MTRTVHVEHCMGTAFTIDVRDPGDWTGPIADVVAWLHRIDALFSTFRPGSDLSRIRRDELAITGADPLVAVVLALCERHEAETGGYFTARWRGAPDPTGLVKGWAVERASTLLRRHGSGNHAVNGGGDMQLAGEAAPGRPWRVGISDPADSRRILTVVTGRDLAVATSGTAERGTHVVDPFTGTPATGLTAVTVTGSSLTRADAYATAAMAMGDRVAGWASRLDGHDVFVVDARGPRWITTRSGVRPDASRGGSRCRSVR
jgi:thiamine biosynthesis lipoprotein